MSEHISWIAGCGHGSMKRKAKGLKAGNFLSAFWGTGLEPTHMNMRAWEPNSSTTYFKYLYTRCLDRSCLCASQPPTPQHAAAGRCSHHTRRREEGAPTSACSSAGLGGCSVLVVGRLPPSVHQGIWLDYRVWLIA